MAFKATSKAINGKNSTSSNTGSFKATKRQTYDFDVIYGWETTNKQSLDIINDYNNRINKSEWLDEEERKKYRSALDSYIETANLLRGINKTFGKGYSEEDEQKWNDSIASMNSGYDEINNLYGKYTSGDAFKKAMEDAAAWQKDYDEKMSYNLVAAENEIRYLNAILDLPNEITKLKQKLSQLNLARSKSDPYGTYHKEYEAKSSRLEALENELAGYMNYFGSEAAIKSIVSEKSAYYTLAKRVQDGARLGGVSNPESEYYDPNFEEYSKLGNSEWWENIGSKTNKNGIAIYDDLKAATLVMNEKWLGKELFSEDMATPKGGIDGYFQGLSGLSEYNNENIDTVNIFREMKDDEISTLAYYLQKDKENGTNLAEQYVGSLRPKLNARMGEKIAATKNTIASQYLFAVEAGIDQYFEGRDALFSGEDYIPTSATQYASGIVRENLADKGILLWYNFKDGKWENEILGSSTGQIFYDALNTTANMLPSVLTSAAVNTVLPGVGSTVGLGILGIGAAGNAKAEMLNLGYSKEQANAYGLLVGASEVLLEKILGGIPGLKGGDGIFSSLAQKIFGKIDNTLARVAIAIGGNIDESLEEGLQAVLEPWLKEMATNVDWEAANVDEILYSSLLGYLSSVGFTGLDMAGNKIKYNAALNKHGQSIINKGGVDSIKQLASEMSRVNQNKQGQKIVNLVGKVEGKASAKNVGKLSAFMEDTATSQNETALTQALAKKGLSKNVATKVAKYIMDSKELSKADVATIEGSQKIQSLIDEVLADPNLEVNDIGVRLMAARAGVSSATNQTKSETVSKNAPAKENATGGDFEASVTVKNAEGKTVNTEIQSVELDGDKASFTLTNGEKVGSDKVAFKSDNAKMVADIAVENASRVKGFSNEAATAMIKGYDGSISPADYTDAFRSAFKMGASGVPSSKLIGVINSGVSERVAYTAYELGRQSVEKATSDLKSLSNNGIINTNESEAKNESSESIHLRNGSKRDGGKNTKGQVSRMESGTGQTESRRKTARIADSEAARLVNEGREVKVSDLGILGGSNEQTVRVVDKANETSSMKEARKRAEARGLKVTFFVGDNLVIKDKRGEWISVRGYIYGDHVFVRADHSLYTADQITRHELGHDMIAKGEVDIKAVRERLEKTVGKENIDKLAEFYTEAYEGSGMSAEDIWEECICDSLGDMNIFAGNEVIGTFFDTMLPEIKKAASDTKSPTQTRGSPEGKASRETGQYSEEDYKNYGWVRHNNVINAGYWRNFTENFAQAVNNLQKYPKSKSGEFMISVYDVYSESEVDDVIVFAKGTIESPNITKIIKFNLSDESEIDPKRRNLYETERRGIQQKAGEIFDINYKADFVSGLRKQGNGAESNRNNNGFNANRNRSEIKANPITQFNVNEDENTVTYTYKNGETVTESLGKASRELDSKYKSAEEAKQSGQVSDAKFSIEFADDIANKQRKFVADGLSRISSEELEQAIADTAHMVDEMKPYANILPQDKVGKTLVKNGSYDISVENTTICIRTLAYNSFVDMVSEKVGRPLSQMESFLVSQKLYEIAKEPQCLYCYVSLDRKAFNEMIIRYTEQRDATISAYEAAGKPKIPSKFDAEWSLFKDFLDGRKPTKNMWDRYVGWLEAYNKGERFVSLEDISTESKRLELVEGGGAIASQVKDMLKYAQSASWAKKQTQYVAYYDEILKLKPAVIRNLNSHYGMRWYSFSDYSGAFIVENMQQITDAAIRGLKGLSYTKDTDFAEIFAPTGMNINISVYAKKGENGYEVDAKQSANIDDAIRLRNQYPNVGIVVVATDAKGVEWALSQEWSDVVIPFHTVRTGADVAEFYNWEIFNAEQNDTIADQNLWDAYVNSVGKKKVSKMVYPSEHQNDRDTYLRICEERGLTPRFKSFLNNPNYMKLVNETRQSEGETQPLKPNYNIDAAERSFDKFVEKGGYYEGWYNDGIDVDGEAEIVAEDVKSGKKANEVSYGRQDINFDDLAKGRKTNRQHGKASREFDTEYLSAVERGDMETAQRMVDEAAKEAGYTVRGLHATNAEFTVFDISKTSEFNYHGRGIYFTNSQRDVENNYENYEGPDPWQKIEGEAYELLYDKYGLSYEDTLTSDSEIIEKLNECYDEVIAKFKKTLRRITAYLKFDNPLIIGKGETVQDYDISKYDGIIDKHVYENIGHSGMDENTVHYIVLNPNNIKSADPVTYDDNGNVIPLSERFNTENSDIRYSRELDFIDFINEQASEEKKPLTNREILADALETAAQNDIERNKLQQYKEKIDLINAEQAKLHDLRGQIKELSFAKGPRDTEAIKKLQREANQAANRINTYDRQLLNLESTKALKGVLEREKTKARKKAEQKGKEALERYKEKAAKTQQELTTRYQESLERQRERAEKAQKELITRYQESRKKAREGRHKTEERHAIKALKEKFMRMLENPTEKQYVPATLISAMVDVCQLIDTDTDLYKPDGSINKAQQARNEQMQKLLALRDEYAKLGNHPDPMYKGEFDEEVLQYLDELRTDYAGKSLSEMTLAELKELRITLRAIEETLRDARKLIGWGEAELVYDAADAIITGQKKITEKRKGKGESTAKAAIIDNSLSPLRNINRMADYDSDSPLVKLFREIELGVRKKNKFAMDAHKSFEDITTGNNAKKYEDAIYKPHGKEYVDKEGRKFRVSKMEKMQAIMSYDREIANNKLHHVSEGGFTFADLDLLNKGKLLDAIDPRNAHSVTFGAVIAEEFRSELANDAWAQEYMRVASQFFDETAKKAINDANMLLKHRLVATGSKYIPYEVNKDYVVREITSENDIQQTISGYGMLKDLKEGATQPLIITGLNNILERHIDQASNIHGLAVPIRNFNKVWNVKSLDGSTTVNESIGRNWGNRGKQVMIQAVKDVQGARISHRSAIEKKLKSNVIGATFTFNGSVVTKQVGSLFAATAKMRWRNPASMIANLIYTMANHKKISAEVDKYTASAWMRRQGMSDAELYTLTTEARKKGFTRFMSKLPTFMNPTKWITGMDSMVALSLWKYAKEDVAKQTGLEGEELLQAAAEYYDDIIENTQSMSDALHRPEIQKRDDLLSDALGTFKTDLYQGAGLLRDALGEYKANKTKENAANLARAITANVMSALWGSVMTSVFALLRYKVNRYRDDEDDELEAESWLSVQGRDIIGEIIGYAVPLFGGEVADIVMAIINGESVDSFDNFTLEAVNNLISSISGIANSISDKEMPSKAAFQKFITSIASAFNIPANNVARLFDAIKLHAEDIANGEFFSFEAGLTSPNSTRLYNAYIEGDADKIEKASRLFKDEKEINSALRKALRENDTRIKEGAEAYNSGDFDTYESIINEIADEGHFDSAFVSDAIKSEAESIKDKKEEIESDSSEKDNDKAYSIYEASDINIAFDNGDTAKANEIIQSLIKTKVANGKTEKEAKASLRSSMTSYWKPLYLEAYKSGNSSEMARIRKILYSSKLYGSTNDVVEACKNWLKD